MVGFPALADIRTVGQPISRRRPAKAPSLLSGGISNTPKSLCPSTKVRMSCRNFDSFRLQLRTTSSKPVPANASRMPCWISIAPCGSGSSQMSPMRDERRNARPRACGSGEKCRSLITALTRSRVAVRTNGELLMTRETVFFETLASRATSLIVGLRCSALPVACALSALDFFLAGTCSCDRVRRCRVRAWRSRVRPCSPPCRWARASSRRR